MSENILYLKNKAFVKRSNALYPVTHMFVVKEKTEEDFKFLVYGEGGINRAYHGLRSEPDYDIDWGDGTITRCAADSGYASTHTYENSGEYVITIKNHKMGMIMPVDAWLEILSPFPEMGVPEQLPGYFEIAQSLRKICAKPFYRNPQIRSFLFAFRSTPLKEIPKTLFEGCINAIIFEYCFSESKLTGLPDEMFKYCPDAETMKHCFYNCWDLLYLPGNLFKGCKKVKSFQGTFDGCDRLTGTIDRLFDDSQDVEDFSHCFYRCENLTGKAPELWLRTNPVPNGNMCFWGCENLSNYDDIPGTWGGSWE